MSMIWAAVIQAGSTRYNSSDFCSVAAIKICHQLSIWWLHWNSLLIISKRICLEFHLTEHTFSGASDSLLLLWIMAMSANSLLVDWLIGSQAVMSESFGRDLALMTQSSTFWSLSISLIFQISAGCRSGWHPTAPCHCDDAPVLFYVIANRYPSGGRAHSATARLLSPQ